MRVTIVRTSGYYQSPVTTALIQIISLALAALALIVGAYLLIIGKRPWRGGTDTQVAPRVRLLGVSYILVFGAAMIQIITQPRGLEAVAIGGLMVLGGAIVIVVVFLEARASRRMGREDQLDSRLRD
jgi:threonine/homoserine/homoserine lactone efflux protein